VSAEQVNTEPANWKLDTGKWATQCRDRHCGSVTQCRVPYRPYFVGKTVSSLMSDCVIDMTWSTYWAAEHLVLRPRSSSHWYCLQQPTNKIQYMTVRTFNFHNARPAPPRCRPGTIHYLVWHYNCQPVHSKGSIKPKITRVCCMWCISGHLSVLFCLWHLDSLIHTGLCRTNQYELNYLNAINKTKLIDVHWYITCSKRT